MATTSLIVETLIAGLQALIWLALGLVLFLGTTWINFSALKDWVSLILFFVIAVAYALGIIVERSASFCMAWLEDRFKVKDTHQFSKTTMRMEIMTKNSTLSEFIEGYRHQYRMLASTTINVFICLVLLFLAYAFPEWLTKEEVIQNFAHQLSPVLFYVLLILFISTIFHWTFMHRHSRKYIQDAHTIVNAQKGSDGA